MWVKRTDVQGARYDFIKNVDPQELVAELIARWVAQAKLDMDPSLVTLRLVKSSAADPSPGEEASAKNAEDLPPRLTLADAGIKNGCSLLAFTSKSAFCASLLVFVSAGELMCSARAGSPLTEASVAARELALRELDTGVQQIEQFTVALKEAYEQVDPKLTAPYYVTVPPHPSLQFSSRCRFLLDGDSFTFMRRQGSRDIADWLLVLLSRKMFAAYFQGPQGVGKSHLLYEMVLLLTEQSDCRVVYEHDCASWAGLANMPIKATLYWLRSVAMAFAQDPEVLGLCRQFIERVSVMTDIVAAEDAVCNSFLPQLGDLCKRLKLKVFFVFDQHNSLTPEMRTKFPYSLPESQLLRVSQLRGVGMVVISASANNEYFLKLATLVPPLPTRLVTSGFDDEELGVFVQHERLFKDRPLDDDQLRELSVATNCYPLELALLRDAHNALQSSFPTVPVTLQRCVEVYEKGDVRLGVVGSIETFAARIAAFDKRVRGEPDERQRLINGVVCMKLELPLSTFPYAVLLNLAICYKSDVPQSLTFAEQSQRSGSPEYIHPITPAALQAAVAFYSPDAAYTERESSAVSFIFQSPQLSRPVRGHVLEDYIMHQLSSATSFELVGRKYGAKHKRGARGNSLASVRGLQTVRWYGEIPSVDLNLSKDLLLWPYAYNYPGVDGLIWLAKSRTLLLLQITLSSVGAHASNFWKSNEKLHSRWLDRLSPSRVYELWVTPYTDAGSGEDHLGQYVCTLAELMQRNQSLFPLLKNWEPTSEVS